MRSLGFTVLCVLMIAGTAQARPGYLGPYQRCGYTYAEAAKKCSGAFAVDYKGSSYRIKVESYGKSGRWLDGSAAGTTARKVVLKSDWNWLYYQLRSR